ncbi:glycosyltransferase [Jejuia pallidilutea]|uniref:Glycosyltransferase n=1 Tax=Jejuia pallidilutea TaxID=504487 RepID=A0A090W4J1_9FLAO|nr:glycosyltransferase [Jejuia pallidilutea]
MYIETVIIVIYTIALLLIFIYALAQLNLLFNYLSAKNISNEPKFNLSHPEEVPYVTIQLPVYNEMYVMERLLDNIAKIDYPKDKLEIQVLDDSTDETVATTKAHIEKLNPQD